MMSLVLKSLMLIIVLQDVTTVLAKPTKASIVTIDKTQPVYELQLAIWPTDVDDIIEAVVEPIEQVTLHPLVEQPIVVMPDMDYTQDDEMPIDDVAENDDDDHEVVYDPNLDLWPTIIADHEPAQPDPVVVLQNYHKKFANGSEEYNLILSNGMVNYQHIDHVLVNGVQRPVQEGHYTIPVEGAKESYQTVYYRADQNGYNVYKTEQSPRNPAYDFYLQYAKDEDAKVQ